MSKSKERIVADLKVGDIITVYPGGTISDRTGPAIIEQITYEGGGAKIDARMMHDRGHVLHLAASSMAFAEMPDILFRLAEVTP